MKKLPGWGRTTTGQKPAGSIRQSQIVTTFGPGAMVDLIDDAILVGGLDFWAATTWTKIQEPRLRDVIAERFQTLGRALSIDGAFREPPAGDDSEPVRTNGIAALEFPQWVVCQNPDCKALVRSGNLDRKAETYVHDCGSGRESVTNPVRFVAACRRGHIDEFPWLYFVHEHNQRERCASPSLKILEGASGDFSEIRVRCTSCGASRPLAHAMVEEANPTCLGERPWLGAEAQEKCSEHLRLMVRTASHSYFSQVMSALSIPDRTREVADAVQGIWDVLQTADAALLPIFRKIPKVEAAIRPFSDEDVLAAVEARKTGQLAAREPLRTAEYRQFIAAPAELPGEIPPRDALFFARTSPREKKLPSWVARVVLAHKLREVRAQIGFTRIEPASPNLQGEYDLGVEMAPLGLTTDWLPATDIRGEGVFIELDEAAVKAWEERPAVVARGLELMAGFDSWAASQTSKNPGSAPPRFPGIRFYLLHSLAHLLVSAVSLECGYSASAIRERIYCAGRDAELPMAAVLLSTGTSGTEGTLGGLVDQGRRVTEHLRRAFELARLCSNDPVCGRHSPKGDHAERFLEGAACHGCLFVAECSCERFNRYLDRALVVPAIGHDPSLAFMGQAP